MKLLDLPVYRRAQAAHSAAFERKKAKAIRSALVQWGEGYAAKLLDREPDGWYPWRYNDVVAWIALSINKGLIEASMYVRKTKTRGQAHPWVIADIVARVYCSRYATSQAIHAELVSSLRTAVSEHLPDKHLDLEGLELIGVHIDWKGLADASVEAR